MKKRLLSLILALAMVISQVPMTSVTAFAAGMQETAATAEDAAEAEDTAAGQAAQEESAEEKENIQEHANLEKESAAEQEQVSRAEEPEKESAVEEESALESEASKEEGSKEETTQEDFAKEDSTAEGDSAEPVVISEDYTITKNGRYQLQEGAMAAITVAEGVQEVTIVGNGVVYNTDSTSPQYGAVSSTANVVTINCLAAPGIHLTLENVYNSIKSSTYTTNMVDFAGMGNRLTVNGTCLLDYDIGYRSSNNAAIHTAKGTALTIDGDGTLYLYKNSQGAAIGGASQEMNGTLVFDMTGSLFVKGTKQGAVIGAGSAASSTTEEPGPITFHRGSYHIVTNSRGAAIGGSAGSTGGSSGTNVIVDAEATLNINTDFSGAAVGGGGYAQGNDASGGTLVVNGGSIRPYVDKNAASNVSTGWNGKKLTEGVNDAVITAQRQDAAGSALYLATVNLGEITAEKGLYTVKIDGGETVFYQGKGHSYAYAFDGVDRSGEVGMTSPASTISNWIAEPDSNLYLYLTAKDHTITINGTSYTYYWDEVWECFHIEKHTAVTFVTNPADAQIVISNGIGYTYVETTHEGMFYEAVEAVEATDTTEAVAAVPAKTKFSLVPGNYTATITKDGCYASEFSFKVTAEGKVTSLTTSSNVKNYLDGKGVFTITLPTFTKSAQEHAWDGVTLDVSWYDADAKELSIGTPAQLAGMAAICNGIYNAEITTILDDVDEDGAVERYTPQEYAKLKNRKIRAASSSGDVGGPNGGNLVSSSSYWYGVQADGSFADFKGKTVLITADLDMGGYQTESGSWSGARYMTIGGQSQMHYIDYSKSQGDGNSHLGSSFNGTFDGQGHRIFNLYCDRHVSGSNYGDSVAVGLIGRLGNHDSDLAKDAAVDPTVRNVAVAGYVYGRRSVAGIVGKIGQTTASQLRDGSTGAIIENCLNFCEVKNTDSKGVGGICGAGWNSGMIRNCANFGSVYAGRQNAGGICGTCEVPVINCYNAGYVNAISYSNAQALGTDNGGAVYTNCYWLTGSSFADSVDTYAYPAVYRHDSSDTITEITTFAGLKTAEYLKNLNGTSRSWVLPKESDAIYKFMASVGFSNNRLETENITAAGMPVPRCFINDTTTLTEIQKTGDPVKLAYIEGQTFDVAGLEIWALYSDGTKELITDYSVSVEDKLSTDDTEIVISGSHGGKEYRYTYAITVEARVLENIGFQSNPKNVIYASDEAFDSTGMKIAAYYSDAPTKAVVLQEGEYSAALIGKQLVVMYTYRNVTRTCILDLTILDTPAPSAKEDVYELNGVNDLIWFANQVNTLNQTALDARLTADLEMPSDFAGIGATSRYYAGTFDGEGHTITLQMKQNAMPALFSAVSGAVIRNVTVDGSVTCSNASSTAGIAGIAAYVGTKGVSILNCTNEAEISGYAYIGGIVGKVGSNAAISIENCQNKGNITASYQYAGGILGYGYEGTIRGCANNGAVTGVSNVGGIAGYFYKTTAAGVVTDSYNAGAVTATALVRNHGVAGIVGYAAAKIQNCYNVGAITAVSTLDAGGAGLGGIAGLGYGASITNCYHAGTLSRGENTYVKAGALLGFVSTKNCTASNSYYLQTEDTMDALGGAYSDKYTLNGETAAKTAEELKALAPVLGDSFKNATVDTYHDGYPILTWETCPVCEHVWGEGIVTKEATCMETGEITYICTCGETKTEEVEKNLENHVWGEGVVTKEATCTEVGELTYTCACGERKTETIAKVAHRYGSWKKASSATVFSAEIQKATCSVCKTTKTRTVGSKLTPVLEIPGKLTSITMKQGKTATMSVTMAKGDSVSSAKSNNTKLLKASLDKSTGKITLSALKAGTAKLTIKLASGKSRTYTVKVTTQTVKTTSLSVTNVTNQKMTLAKGKSYTLKLTRKPFTSTEKITYQSSNTKVATVTTAGKITAAAVGRATITATSGSKSVKITITVPGITNVKSSITVNEKKTLKLSPKTYGISEKVTYQSSNSKIASVTASGTIKGIKKGTAKITIQAGSYKKTVTVTVK